MARRDADAAETIIDVDVSSEMESSFLEYAYSVIYSRALPDARDGLKPVQRRIVFQMGEMGLRPERGHVKSSRIVGDVMGKLHPHGDTAIYDALVRLSQDFIMRVPLVDGHGNFGSLDDNPAAPRYTEARLTKAAMAMIAGLDEDVVDFTGNYDNTLTQPEVLPSALPNLLINGASGIAVGMATNMAPHNPGEVIAAAQHLISNPEASLVDLMRFVPGPDLPSGGRIIGLGGVREAYETGRGTFRTRATASIENTTARRKSIVVTELPYLVGPEKVTEKVKTLSQAKKLPGVASIDDFSDRHSGLRLVIGVKNGFNPAAVLEELYRLTPLEESFGINNVCLVDGQPRTLGLRELLQVYVDHRIDVVRRRSTFQLGKAQDRLHLVEGLLVAILDIDEVIELIRSSDDAQTARTRLMDVFDLTEIQATYILDLQLRRLTKFSRLELEREKEELLARIEELRRILGDEAVLRALVSDELGEMARQFGSARRTVLVEASGNEVQAKGRKAKAPADLQIPDDDCWVLLSTSGMLARTTDRAALATEGRRAKHDALLSQVATTARAHVGAITSHGRLVSLPVVDMPALPPQASRPALSGGAPMREFAALNPGEKVLGLVPLDPAAGPGYALGTRKGVVKRLAYESVPGKDFWDVIALKDGDEVAGMAPLASEDDDLVFVSDQAQLLRFPAANVRPQGRGAGGMAGLKLSSGASVIGFAAVPPGQEALVVTIATGENFYGEKVYSAKVTPLPEFPAKGRATGGVRAQRFLKGESALTLAYVGPQPLAASAAGVARALPEEYGKRDASGTPLDSAVDAIGTGPHNRGALTAAESGSGLPAHREVPRASEAEREAIARARPHDAADVVVVSEEEPDSLF